VFLKTFKFPELSEISTYNQYGFPVGAGVIVAVETGVVLVEGVLLGVMEDVTEFDGVDCAETEMLTDGKGVPVGEYVAAGVMDETTTTVLELDGRTILEAEGVTEAGNTDGEVEIVAFEACEAARMHKVEETNTLSMT
jgi:hypothetical protein